MREFKTQKEMFKFILDNNKESYWHKWNKHYIRDTILKWKKEVYYLSD